MNQLLSLRVTVVALAFSGFVLCAGRTRATDISGTLPPTTLAIYEDSELVGDVTCTVADAPCIAFGASGITLRLNGFTITGRAEPPTGCTPPANFPSEDGIDVVTQGNPPVVIHDVAILGPGQVQNFASAGIFLGGVTKVKIKGVTVSDNCFSGIFLAGTTDSDIERNISVRNAIGSQGFACGGT